MARSRTILIAGAGIGGLATALALSKAGFRSVLFERDAKPDPAGAGIQLSPNATRALNEIGALAPLMKRAIEPESLVVSNGINRALLAEMPLKSVMAEKFGSPYLVCLRPDLHETLLSLASDHADIEIRYGISIGDFAIHNRGITALAYKGTQAEEINGLALIGADGIRSLSRLRLAPDAKPAASGFAAWRALLPAGAMPDDCRRNEVRIWLGPGGHLVHYPAGDGSRINLVAVARDARTSESWGEECSPSDILPFFAHWNEEPRAVLALAQQFRRWTLNDIDPLTVWTEGRATLLGDAAHAMMPFLAQGAAATLEDAAALASTMCEHEDVAVALRRYEGVRIARATRMQREARKAGRAYHIGWPWWHARDAVLQRLGGAGLLKRNEWIYRG